MYVNKGDDKIKQLHADIGRTIPKEDLKLGQKMKDGDIVSALQKSKNLRAKIAKQIKEAKKTKYPEVPSKEELLQIILDFEKKEKEKENKNKNKKKLKPFYRTRNPNKYINVAKGGKIKKKKYSYRRGGLTTLRKPKRG